jgi:hypothetical protein
MVATKNITDLNALVTPQADDLLLIVERLSATSTEAKKITWANVQEAIQDIVGNLVQDDPASPSTITVNYDDTNGVLTAHVVNDTSTQRARYSEAGTLKATRQEANYINGVGINVDIADNSGDNRADITVKNTGVVNAENNTVTGTSYEFLSSVTVEADGSKTLELRPLKLGSNQLSATYSDSDQSLTIDLVPGNIDINTLNTATPLGVSVGGTGANNAATARNNLGAAKLGANSDISSLSGLTTPLSISQGGTGANTADGSLKNLQGLNSAVGVGAIGEQIVYQSSVLVSGSYRAEFKGIKPTSSNYITVATDGSDIALGANPNNIFDGISGTRNANGARITNAGTPINSNDVATKSYVDSQTTGLDVKASVRAATTGNLASSYSGVGQTLTANSNGAISIDGESLALNDRVLVKDQTALTENGIYKVTTVGDGSTPYVLTRSDDFNTSAEAGAGAFTYVEAGTSNSGKSFVQTTRNVVLDTSDLVFSVFGESAIGTNSIANDKLQQVTEATIKGRAAGAGTGNVSDLSADQLVAVVNAASAAQIDQARIDITGLAPVNDPTFTGTVTIPSGASIAGFAKLATAQTYTAAQRGSVVTLTDNPTASVSVDFAAGNNFELTLTGSSGNTRILANPSNVSAGQSGVITVIQSSNGNNLLTYGSDWDFSGTPIPLSTTANAVDTIAYYVISATKIRAVLIKD